MSEDLEQMAPGVTRQVKSSTPNFSPFTSISGASSTVVAGLSREEGKYQSIPMASILFNGDGDFPSHAFTLAVDDLVFVNVVLSTSLKEIVLAYQDGAISNIKEGEDISERLAGLVDHWEALAPIIRKFAQQLKK